MLDSGRTVGDLVDLFSELSDVVDGLWDDGAFTRLPVPIVRNIASALEKLGTVADGYADRSGGPQDLEKRLDALHTQLWQNNLIDRLDELPGYEAKNERFEFLKRKGRRIIRELRKGLEQRDEIVAASTEVKKALEDTKAHVATAKKHQESAEEHETTVTEVLGRVRGSLKSAKEASEQTLTFQEKAQESQNAVEALRKKIEKFYESVEEHEKRMEELFRGTTKALTENQEKTDTLLARNAELAEQVADQLQKATGASLFHAFHERKRAVVVSKWIWAAVSILGLGFAVWWGVYLAGAATDRLDTLFFIKLAGTAPLLALLVFALTQYGRERRAEEEYAFKSALSLSLVPYKELIEEVEQGENKGEFAKFLVRTIGQIYEAPRLKEDGKQDGDAIPLKGIEQLTRLIEKVVDKT